jgi:hypothetical protein
MPKLLWDTQAILIKVANLLPGQHPSNIVRDSAAFQQTVAVPAKYLISCRFHFGIVQQIRKSTVVKNLWWSGLLFNSFGEMDCLHAKDKVTEQPSSSKSWSDRKFHTLAWFQASTMTYMRSTLFRDIKQHWLISQECRSLPRSWLMDVWITGKLKGTFQGHIPVLWFPVFQHLPPEGFRTPHCHVA